VTGDDIRRAIRDGIRETLPLAAATLNEQVAGEILTDIDKGKDFWTAVYEPYSRNMISRDVVRLVIEQSRGRAGKGMPQIARDLKAISGDVNGDEEERKRFFKFKNFLYKTVKI